MSFLLYFSEIVIPLTAAYIVMHGLAAKRNVFEDFTKGAADGIHTAAKLLPTLIGLLVGTKVLRASGLLDFLCNKIGWLISLTGIENFPEELLPLSIVKLISASAANGLLLDIFKEFGTDSFIGMAASIMMSCSETMLYCLSIYFGSVHITKTRWTIPGCLLAIIAGITASIILAGILCS